MVSQIHVISVKTQLNLVEHHLYAKLYAWCQKCSLALNKLRI
jgi:hypothetical protein